MDYPVKHPLRFPSLFDSLLDSGESTRARTIFSTNSFISIKHPVIPSHPLDHYSSTGSPPSGLLIVSRGGLVSLSERQGIFAIVYGPVLKVPQTELLKPSDCEETCYRLSSLLARWS